MFQVLAYINHWLRAVDAHSIHSPFLYQFYKTIIKAEVVIDFGEIESLRNRLLDNTQEIEFKEIGAGSRVGSSSTRSIRHIVRHSSTPPKFSHLLYRLIQFNQSRTVLELGTSLGLNTLYMHKANTDADLFTFEGIDLIADYAQKHFDEIGAGNVRLIRGNIDQSLQNQLKVIHQIDFAYLDANHTYEATIRYFNQIRPHLHSESILVLDDIHWSKEMQTAWKEIKSRPDVSISLDLFEAGILFFKSGFPKTDLVLKF